MRKCSVIGLLIVIITFLCCVKSEANEWRTDFKKAAGVAKASGKYMLLDFSGSDWCVWCKKLDKKVFSQDNFKNFAKDNLVCVLVDFPSTIKQPDKLKQQNKDLA